MTVFLIKKWLSLILFPLSQSILMVSLSIVLFWRSSRQVAFTMLLLAAAWLWLSSTAIFADWLLTDLEKGFESPTFSSLPKADAIVLLGGATSGLAQGGDMGNLNESADRLITTLKLFKLSKAPLVIVTGGAADDSISEASLMRDMLELMGIPLEAIILEEKALDTRQNAEFTAKILHDQQVSKILLVTSAYHMRRAKWIFDQTLGLEVEVIAVASDHQRSIAAPMLSRWIPSVGDLYRTSFAIKEIVGYWVYRQSLG